MTKWQKYKNLGYEQKIIDKCRYEIDKDNIVILKSVTILLMIIIFVLILFYSIFDRNNYMRIVMCAIAGISLAGIYSESKRVLTHNQLCTPRYVSFLINILMLLCFFVAIYLGTFAAQEQMGVAPVWMFFFAILIFNRLPLQNLFIVVFFGIIFIGLSYFLKSPYLFQYDTMHAITSIIASIYMSWSKSKMKIENILTLTHLEHINEEILEVVEEKEKETEILRYKASVDELTGFYKKDNFEKIVSRILEQTTSDKKHLLICFDIDDFKKVNDTFGHMYGDIVLSEIVNEIVENMGLGNIFGRFGGDEFLVFVENIEDVDEFKQRLMHLDQNCQKEYCENGKERSVSLSYGYATYPMDGTQYTELFKKADNFLYEMKKKKKTNR